MRVRQIRVPKSVGGTPLSHLRTHSAGMVIAQVMAEVSMPKQDFNKGLESDGPHRQGEKGGKGGEIEKAGRSAGDGTGKDGNKQIGPFDQRDDDKRPRVSSEDQKSSNN